MSVKVSPEVTADEYEVEGHGFNITVIKIRESRGRRWASAVVARILSRSEGDEHHARVYRPNGDNVGFRCTCKAAEFSRKCHAVRLVEQIAQDNEFWKR